MRFGLRWKILLIVVLAPATLGVATILTVSRNVKAHVEHSSIHESLAHSAAVFESMLRTRWHVLSGSANVIARDPRFFSLLMLQPDQRDSRFVRTVRGVAVDFNRITETDLFEVANARGRILASVGRVSSTPASRTELVRAALQGGRTIEAVLATEDAHYQVVVVPVHAGKQIVGVLLLGAEIGTTLARELEAQMRCEVTFLSGNRLTGTSLTSGEDRAALLASLTRWSRLDDSELQRSGVQKVKGAIVTYLTLVRPIPNSEEGASQLYVIQRAYDPEMAFLDRMKKDMALLAIVALLAALITGLLFSEQIVRPLQSLVRAAREMEKGNYEHPLGIRRGDEIGYLADRFAAMRQREKSYLGSLEQAMQLKSQFLSIASHELRTPISVLIGYRDMLASEELGPLTPRQKEAFEVMRLHLDRLTCLADDSARFARVKSERLVLERRPHEIEPILRRAVALARAAAANRDVRVEAVTEPMSGPADVDAAHLEEAILQLVTNGIRFTEDGGMVEVRAGESEGKLQIRVRDNGIGIARGKLEALLSAGVPMTEANRYQSATGLQFNAPGLGLGLSIARAIVEAHGGVLHAVSTPGQGSTFHIEIPLKAEPLDQAA